MEVVGLDIDRTDGSAVEARIRQHPAVAWLRRRRSASGNLHYRVGLRHSITAEAAFALRRLLGDDPTRVIADEDRHRHGEAIDVLYDVKGGRRAGPWVAVFGTA